MMNTDEIVGGMPHVTASPADGGKLELIIVRPAEGERVLPGSVRVSPEQGVEGDKWVRSRGHDTPDGGPDPRTQVTLMNARILRLISGEEGRMPLAGDNLIVDLDLSDENMAPGQRLSVGEAVLEVTEVPHNGCRAFLDRYGTDVVKFVNSPEGKRLHLRGLHAKVITAGVVSVGDEVRKVAPE